MVDIENLLKQAQEMQSQIQAQEKEMSSKEFLGKSGGGLVQVICTGKGDIKKINIDPSIIKSEDKVMIEDLIIAAFTDAKNQAEKLAMNSINNIFNIIEPKEDK
jgi:DNA-binding YbaB/EbfC family protein